MQPAEQIQIAERLFDYIDNNATATADEVYAQPVAEYTDRDTAKREQRTFFRQRPQCVGMSGLLAKPGSYTTHDYCGLPLLLTRDRDGRFHAFLNVCRHRGARVAEGCGSQGAFVCPYHAWTYGLDGQLTARPEEQAFRAAPREEHGLTELPSLEHNGLLWVVPTPGASIDMNAHLGDLGSEIASFNLGDFHYYDCRIMRRRMNWKLLVDTFLESYHFCVLHKDSICSIFYDNLTTFDNWGEHFRLVAARRTIEEIRHQPSEQWNLLPHMVGIYILFPNTVFVWQLDHVELWQIYPGDDAPDESVVRLELYTPEPTVSESAKRHWENNLDLVVHVVENEDFPVGEGIQRGFYTSAQDHIVFGQNEPALAFFHRNVTRALTNSG